MKRKISFEVGTLIVAILLIIFAPFLLFCIGCFIGLLIKIIFGSLFVSGLALIHINITPNQIPLFCGVLGVIGSFFKNYIKQGEN